MRASCDAAVSASYLGIDVGTSGIRACLIDTTGQELATAQTSLPEPERNDARIEQAPALWWQTLEVVLDQLQSRHSLRQLAALAIDGTSATLLACDAQGQAIGTALMYNDHRAQTEAALIANMAPLETGAQGAHSSLAKALWLLRHRPQEQLHAVLHQADWLAAQLTGIVGISDENNALKLGYDPVTRRWPSWIAALKLPAHYLPNVVAPGTRLGPLLPALARRWDIPRAQVLAGTTDSTAAFLATGARNIGQAVTSLGSTLVLKVLAERPIFAPEYGVYSHRLGERWLVGGASNSGGAVLRQYFSDEQLRYLELNMDPLHPTGLDYYPLPGIGERFPVSDPQLVPRMTPRPSGDAIFLQGLLEGIGAIEQRGYSLLQTLGAPYPSEVISSGGGADNAAWRQLRERLLGVPVTLARHQDTAYGTALLARNSHQNGIS